MSSGSSRPNLVLVGFMGAGKTTVARALAGVAELEPVDLDQVIVDQSDRTIPEIFATKGESAFRDIETAALASLVGRSGSVVATGGGVVMRPENWNLMRSLGAVVYLDADLKVLKSRLAGDTGRPLADGEVTWTRLEALWRQRQPLYEQADLTVDCGSRPPEEIAREILARLHMEHNKR